MLLVVKLPASFLAIQGQRCTSLSLLFPSLRMLPGVPSTVMACRYAVSAPALTLALRPKTLLPSSAASEPMLGR